MKTLHRNFKQSNSIEAYGCPSYCTACSCLLACGMTYGGSYSSKSSSKDKSKSISNMRHTK